MTVVALAVWGMKRYYADARPDDLWWILSPTAHLAGAVTGVRFVTAPGEGYVSLDHLFLIEKSCAGINFMIAAFVMTMFALFHRATSGVSVARVLGASLLASYMAAVLVNAARIVIALWLAAHPIAATALSAAQVHRVEGIIVYFGGLMLLYAAVQRLDRGVVMAGSEWALPLVCYYAVTLVLPLANGAAQAGAPFAGHALIVLVLPPMFIVVAKHSRLLIGPALAPRPAEACMGNENDPRRDENEEEVGRTNEESITGSSDEEEFEELDEIEGDEEDLES